MKKPESICIFGDSTAWGAWDMEKGGWVNRLWFYVAKRDEDYVEIYNQSISGGTTETILERFENEAKIRGADAIIFQTGGNDASYDKPGNFMVQPEKFRSNLEEIIKRAKKITDKIVFMDLKNCDESKTTPVPWIPIYYTNENIKKYSKIMEEVCRENNVPFLDVGLLENEDFDDGLHPNAEGHRKIYEKVKGFLTENNWI
ncbi:MAG: GDSL-type esterase/lipase family protein [Minisyncoccia bacterium]